jgi:glucokinase
VLAVGVDVGGTKLAAGLVAADGSVIERARVQTPTDAGAITAAIVDVARDLARRHDLDRVPVGVGAAGIVDRDGTMRYAPNLPWVDVPLGAQLSAALGGPVTVDNDANVAAWGEFCVGAGASATASMVMLTIGTGVGGGLVLDGALVRGANGLAAEFGHLVVEEGGALCPCGNRGCLEALASGTAIGRRAQERRDAGQLPPDSRLHQLAELSGKSVTVAAHSGDEAAVEIVADCGFWLGVGIASLVNALDPELVVIGGGAMQAGEVLLGPARRSCAERIMGRGHREEVPIVRAQLADDAGLVGAALLARAAA